MIMTSETIKLNLIPGGDLPVLHSSQFDSGRALTFEIYDGEELFTSFDAYDISLHARKVDGTIIGIDTYNVDSENHQVIFFTTEQLTACAGKNICELVFTDSISGSVVGSCNFILEVEPDPYAGGIDSESDIENLSTQIAAIVDSQLDNYYTKEEIDDQIETIVTEQVTPIVSGIVSEQVPPIVESELTNYYTKSETDSAFYNKSAVDTLLSGKADTSDLPDMTNYYDKSTTDTLLASKANTSTTYTKTEVDNLIAAIPSNDIKTAITTPASVMTFNDGGDNIPLKSLLLELPESVGGYSDVSIAVTSEFLYDENDITEGYYVDSNGDLQPVGVWNATDYIPVSGSTLYYWGIQTTGTSPYSAWYDENKQFISSFKQESGSKFRTIPANARYVRFSIYQNDVSRFQCALNKVSTLIQLGETLTQGGSLEVVSGLLTRTDTTTSQITGTNINTFSGVNNIYQSRGDVISLEYFNNKADDIAAMISLMTRS